MDGNEQMRVLHVIPSLSPLHGGPSISVPALASALSCEGLNVHMATTNASGSENLSLELGAPMEQKGVTTFYFPRQRPRGYTFSWPLTHWLWQHLVEYDLVHITAVFSYPTIPASRIARRIGLPYIVSPRGMLDSWAFQYKGWKKRPYFECIEKKTLNRSAALHALTENEVENFRDLGLTASSFVLPNGIYSEAPGFSSPREKFETQYPQVKGNQIVLFLGRIDPKKGLDTLVSAFAQTLREKPKCPAHLIIAGPDLIGYRGQIEKLTEGQGIQNQVTFTGELTGKEKQAALGAADIFVLPSRSEGFSIAILEAMEAGCPVIITENCHFPQVATHGAGVVIQADKTQLTEALIKLLEDKKTARAMGERGRALVGRDYRWSVIAKKMVRVYQDILDGNRRSDAWAA